MKKYMFILLFVFSTQIILSQTNSYDVNIDTRSITMGESTVALTSGFSMPDINPASLTGLKGISAHYNKRNLKWTDAFPNTYYLSSGIDLKSSIGSFAFSYKKYDHGEYSFATLQYPDGVGRVNIYDQTFIFSYANYLVKNLSAGINIKTYNSVFNIIKFNAPLPTTNHPLLFDLGFIYNLNRIIDSKDINDNLNFGVSLQNFGSDYTIDYKGTDMGLVTEKITERLSRFLRLGFAYELNIPGSGNYDLFNFIFTGEYRNLLLSNEYDDSEKDFWGFGFESTFF